MKAALYGRVSTDKQSKDSVTCQYRVCERHAERIGAVVVACFGDDGISGGTHQRPGYQAMLAAARRHEFDMIIAEDLKRFWREQAGQWRAIKELLDLNIHVVTVSGIDSRQQNFEIIASVIGAAAELDRKEASYRTRRGLEGIARSGRPTGGKAFGYVAADKQITIDEGQAQVVRRIFQMYAEGSSPRTIAATLNAEGIPSPGARWNRTVRRKDKKWLASAIHGDVNRGTGILNNRRYVGVTLWGRSEWKRSAADSKRRRNHMLPAGSAVETVEEQYRIVPQALWDKAKARQQRNSEGVGALVRGGLRRRAPGAGRPARH